MNKFYKYPTLISFIPGLIFIPLLINIIINFHSGGIDVFNEFIYSSLSPNLDKEIILITLRRLNDTLRIASVSWLISLLFGIILGTIASKVFYMILGLPLYINRSVRIILTIIRSLHELIWCLILMQFYGINISTAIIAICIPFTAINAKVISEQLDNIVIKNIEAIIQINGRNLSTLFTLIWSPIIQTINNFGIYRFECALRSTAVLGLFGVGGIGTSIYLSWQAFNFKELWTYLWGLAILIILLKHLFKKIKLNKINPKISLSLLIISILVLIYSSYFSLSFLIDFDGLNLNLPLSGNFSPFEIKLVPYEFLNVILETICISLFAICIAIALPPIMTLIFNHNLGRFFIRGIAFWLRIIPPPVIMLLLLMFNRPSIALAAFTLGIHNAAITSNLLLNNLDNLGREDYIAIKSIGAPKRISWLLGLFSKQAKSYLAYCSYRADIIVRETAIVSTVGGIGLGWQLRESLSSFAWGEVIIILFSYFSIAALGEIINGKIKSFLN